MPFDGLTSDQYDQFTLFQQRRENAANFLCAISPDCFDLARWESCALGCMARANHDGWFLSQGDAWRDDQINFHAAVTYFGLSYIDAIKVFGGTGSEQLYNKNDQLVTPNDVGTMLMLMPVYVV
jgi:hypothetical protein